MCVCGIVLVGSVFREAGGRVDQEGSVMRMFWWMKVVDPDLRWVESCCSVLFSGLELLWASWLSPGFFAVPFMGAFDPVLPFSPGGLLVLEVELVGTFVCLAQHLPPVFFGARFLLLRVGVYAGLGKVIGGSVGCIEHKSCFAELGVVHASCKSPRVFGLRGVDVES